MSNQAAAHKTDRIFDVLMIAETPVANPTHWHIRTVCPDFNVPTAIVFSLDEAKKNYRQTYDWFMTESQNWGQAHWGGKWVIFDDGSNIRWWGCDKDDCLKPSMHSINKYLADLA